MNIWYLNHYASPPGNGLPGRPYALARSMALLGHEVINFCAAEHHLRSGRAADDELNRIVVRDGVKYFQIPARPYQGNGYSRLMNMLDYSGAIRQLEELVGKGLLAKPDILIPSCVHLFTFSPARVLAKKMGAKLIFEVRDIWPLSLVELAGVSRWHPLILWMDFLERCAYRNCDAVVSLLPEALEHMGPRGLNRDDFHYIPNGINLDEWTGDGDPLPEEHKESFRCLREQGKLIVVYTGAHGPPNALDQIMDLAEINQNRNVPYHFVLIGDGVEREKLIQRSKEENLSFVTFLPRVTKRQAITAIRAADVCFISLKDVPVFRFGVSPNKLGDYLVAGKPVIYAIKAGNDPVRDAKAGVTVDPYNAAQLDTALQNFTQMSQVERDALGENGRKYALENLDWRVLGQKYADICESLLCR